MQVENTQFLTSLAVRLADYLLPQSIPLNFTLRSFSDSCCLILNNLENKYYPTRRQNNSQLQSRDFDFQAPALCSETLGYRVIHGSDDNSFEDGLILDSNPLTVGCKFRRIEGIGFTPRFT
jgi:hypothetical protein